MGIGVSGLMSGLNTDSIISKLMDLERRPIVQLQNKEAGYQGKITALGLVKSSMSDLKSAVEALKTSNDFLSYKAASDNADILTVSAGKDVQPGSYNIVVRGLASAQQVRSSAFTGSNVTIGTGTLNIQVGSGTAIDVKIDSNHNTLTGIAQAINDAKAGVTADAVDDGSGHYYLTLQSQETGASNTISLTIQDDDGNNDNAAGLSAIYTDPLAHSLTETQAAGNAQLTVNGITVERSSNNIKDLIVGLSMKLKGADAAKTVSVTISKSYSGITNKLNSFIKNYNALIDTLKKQTSYNAAAKQGGTLMGDSTVGRLSVTLSNMIYGTVTGISNSVNSLSKVGIKVDNNGHVSLDESKLTSAIKAHPDDVATFFTSEKAGNKGIAVRLYDFLDGYLKNSTGILTTKTDGLQSSIDDIKNRIEQINMRLSKREANLRHQFNALENMMAQFQQTSGQLEQQLNSLSNLNAYISRKK